jgi:Family of unknown function (DUF6308)
VEGKTITIRGDGQREAIVVAWDQGPAFHLVETRSTLTALTITGGDPDPESEARAGLLVTGGAPQLDRLRVTHGRGIVFWGGAAGAIEHSHIDGNDCGILVLDGASPRIEGNEIWANAPHGCGTCQPDVALSPSSPQGGGRRPGGSRAVQQTHLDLKLVGDPITVTIQRVDGGPTLVIEGAQWVAETFFRLDRSAVGPKSYDARVQSCPKDRFELADLRAVNGSMATRMPDKWWSELLDGVPRSWLAALDPAWTLLDLSDAAWEEGHVTDRLRAALNEMVGDHRGLSVATKLLHLKRPALVPILDSLVVDQLGGRGVEGSALIEHVRAEGRRNLDALHGIQRELATIVGSDDQPIRRSLVRILDVLLWATHPGSALYPILGGWRSEFRRTGGAQ